MLFPSFNSEVLRADFGRDGLENGRGARHANGGYPRDRQRK